jgi:hypothetical protein
MELGHWSSCAVHNGPALPVGKCDCGGLDLADDPSHDRIAPFVPEAGRGGLLIEDGERQRLVEPQELPADGLVADASSSDLPNAHDGVAINGDAAGVHLDVPRVAVVPDLKQAAISERFASRSGLHLTSHKGN